VGHWGTLASVKRGTWFAAWSVASAFPALLLAASTCPTAGAPLHTIPTGPAEQASIRGNRKAGDAHVCTASAIGHDRHPDLVAGPRSLLKMPGPVRTGVLR
jgi:hypothetical protein